ncbi:methyltransferase domain-containing protein [Pontibacterium granulatum]|uniref:putative RNA methyltransferase n=1 Tax=Pontibacterium granulatum TaxID=2036029 RepID=UPI002499B68E|nr:methyltransferase domain-containing protein [Pontibacterium granulatum]MDI3323766.1 methyltransferase domain-containing protein [Pontibacterium granulatum]
MNTPLACPVCQQPLQQQDNNLRCSAGHSFDRAKQGYWNLLLSHKKKSKDPGDNAEMVQARRDFLDQGHYRQLSDQINRLALNSLPETPSRILDMGCGEGFYTAALEQALTDAGREDTLIGLDISKHAVKAACARSKSIDWLVASGANIPVPAESLDGLTVLFSRLMPEAFAKPLKPNGFLLLAWTGEQHLIELRELIYDEVRPSRYDPVQQLAPLFALESITEVNYDFALDDNHSIQTLLGMTPHSQRMPQAKREQFAELASLQLTLDVKLGLFRRR